MNVIHPGFDAGLFDPSRGNEVLNGKIRIDRWAVHFQAGQVTEQIPIDEAVVELEAKGDRVYFVDPNRPELKLFTLDRSILRHPSFGQVESLRCQVNAIAGRREMSRRLRITGCFFAGCLFLAWFGSWAAGWMVKSLVNRVPLAWEQSFGDARIRELRESEMLLDDTNEVARLAELAAPLIQAIPHPGMEFKFYISKNEEPNACALPGGHVVVNAGLLQMTDRPEELLGVLAHEIAHVTQRHIERHIISAAGPIVIFGIFLHSRSGLVNLMTEGSGFMVFQGFSQEYETEADTVGWSYLVQANIDPRGMADVFRKLKAYEAEEEMKHKSDLKLPQAFQSHPALDKRIARLEKKWRKLKRKTGFLALQPVDWRNLGKADGALPR